MFAEKNDDATDDGPPFYSYVFMARNVTQSCSVPVQEASSFSISVRMIKTILSAVYKKLTRGLDNLEIYNLGDSKALSWLFLSQAKIANIAIKNRVYQSKVQSLALLTKYPNINIKFGWVRGCDNLADLNSKYKPEPIDAINSRRWRQGLPYILDDEALNQHVFNTVENGVNSKVEQDKLTV